MALPRVTVSHPSVMRLNYAATFAQTTADYAPNATITQVTWNFGDVSAASTSTTHTYPRYGCYTVTATVRDSYNRTATGTTRITVGWPIYVKFTGSTTLHHSVYYSFSSSGSLDYNTGGKISSVTWNFGDGRTATGTSVTHAWGRTGTYTMTETVADNTGVRTTRRITITVVT
jgi:PKD repeat protein